MSDGSWTLKQTLVSGTATGNFGQSVAIDTGHIVVGAPSDNQIYFFNQASQGTSWAVAGTFTGPTGIGGGVALYSTYAMARTNQNDNIVRFYNRGNNGWEEVSQGTQAPTNAQIVSIAIDANFAVAGDGGIGRFYFYKRQNGIWNYVQTVDSTTTGPISMSSFSTISISKTYVLGADGSFPQGRGVVLNYTGAGQWDQIFGPDTINYSNPAGTETESSAVSGRFFAIGAPNSETVYFYDAKNDLTLKTSTKNVQLQGGGFGDAIDMDGNWFIVGAEASSGGNGYAQLLYKGKNGDWTDGPVLTAPANSTRFGSDVSISGTQAAVGADGNGVVQGTVGIYVYSSR